MLAQLVAAVYETGYKLDKRLSPLDFMPSQSNKPKNKAATEQEASSRLNATLSQMLQEASRVIKR